MEHKLVKLGLSGNEAKVYLAALSLGPSPAGKIAKQAGVKRPTTYVALNNLAKFGLISEIPGNKEKSFRAGAPEKLKKLTKKLRRQAMAAELSFEELLPELKSSQKNLVESPRVTFHQGLAGVANVAEEISESINTWYYFGASEEIIKIIGHEQLAELMEETNELREKAGRPLSYYITDEGIKTIKRFQADNPLVRRMKILPKRIKPKSALVIYNDKLAILNLGSPPFAATVESKEVVELLKIMFQMLWDNL
jgi:sugar-specific transcriptional regulator TrmB